MWDIFSFLVLKISLLVLLLTVSHKIWCCVFIFIPFIVFFVCFLFFNSSWVLFDPWIIEKGALYFLVIHLLKIFRHSMWVYFFYYIIFNCWLHSEDGLKGDPCLSLREPRTLWAKLCWYGNLYEPPHHTHTGAHNHTYASPHMCPWHTYTHT